MNTIPLEAIPAFKRIKAYMQHGCYIGPQGQMERDHAQLAQLYVAGHSTDDKPVSEPLGIRLKGGGA